MERVDIIAWLLAVRHDPAIEEMPEYVEALRLLESDAELARAVEAEKVYYDQHEDYLDFIRLPDTARERMKDRLRAVVSPPAKTVISFPWRPLAIAASLVAVVTIGLISLRPDGATPSVAQTSPLTVEALRQFAANQVESGLSLDYRSADLDATVGWLREAGAPSAMALQERFGELPSMGCAVLDWEGEPVSLMCFRIEDETVHLFVASASVLSAQELAHADGRGLYTDRETISWADADNAYVLVAHDPGQKLPGFSG